MKCHSCGSEDILPSIIGGERGILCNECGFYDNLIVEDNNDDLEKIFMEEVMEILHREIDKDE